MKVSRPITYAGITIIALAALGVAFFVGNKYALDSLAIRHASPTQVAAAMKNDDFYSTYGRDTLIVSGVLNQVKTSSGVTTVTFKTNSTYSAACELKANTRLVAGQNLTVVVTAYQASRQSAGILMHNCVIP